MHTSAPASTEDKGQAFAAFLTVSRVSASNRIQISTMASVVGFLVYAILILSVAYHAYGFFVINVNCNNFPYRFPNSTNFAFDMNPVFRLDYERVGNSFYKYHQTRLPWGRAKKVCEFEGAHLAVPNSQAEANYFLVLMERFADSPFVYLGFHDLFNEGEFVTVQDRPLEGTGFFRWNHREPNGGIKENCGTLRCTGGLNDYACGKALPFICEREIDSMLVHVVNPPVPQPALPSPEPTPTPPPKPSPTPNNLDDDAVGGSDNNNNTDDDDDVKNPHPVFIDWRFGGN